MKKIVRGICWLLCSCTWAYTVGATNHAAVANKATAENKAGHEVVQQEVQTEQKKLFTGSAELRTHTNSDKQYLVWSLAEINPQPLSAEDMEIGGVSLGVTEKEVRQHLGAPAEVQKGVSADYYRYPKAAVTIRHSLPEDIRKVSLPGWTADSTWQGVSSIRTETEKYPTARDLAVGNSRENILRIYGRPQQMRWDAKQRRMYYIYGNKDIGWLTFDVENLQIQDIRLDKSFPGVMGQEEMSDKKLLGMEVGKPYHSPAWSTWETHIEQDLVELWMFKDFGITIDKDTGKVERIFLLSPQVTTPRGVALGDSSSTVEHVYGKPDMAEINLPGNITLWYYIQSKKPPIYLIFVIGNDKKEVKDIILSARFLDSSITSEQRYGLN